jgi:hypothetical protein
MDALGEWPYSGFTTSGSCALPSPREATKWVEKPVASGRYALQHMGGTRRPAWRFLEGWGGGEIGWNMGDLYEFIWFMIHDGLCFKIIHEIWAMLGMKV